MPPVGDRDRAGRNEPKHETRTATETVSADDADAKAARQQLRRFRDRLADGNYDAVIGAGLKRTLHGAAADTGLEAEIGALRLTLVRLLNEERDPSRLAAGVSRVAAVAVQAARLRNAPEADVAEIRTALLRELDAVEREYSLAASQGGGDDRT